MRGWLVFVAALLGSAAFFGLLYMTADSTIRRLPEREDRQARREATCDALCINHGGKLDTWFERHAFSESAFCLCADGFSARIP